MKKLIALIMVLALALSMVACGGSAPAAPAEDQAAKIGVSMPTQSLQRWNQDGANMKAMLEKAGYQVDLQYGGDNDIPTQVSQIENMITEGCKVLVIAAIDGSSLTEVLKQAKEQNIPVIAYDRLIMNSDAVSYYATFDNFQVGVMQGQYIETALDLKNAKGPFNIELFTGDPADNNATFFFGGAMSILKPYIDSGVLVVPSGQTSQAQVSTADWKTENAQTRMENLITSNGYSPKGVKLDAVCCSNDSTALGAVNALVSVGYTKDDMPIVTGQDCDKPNVKNMVAGLQSMSVFKDTRTLADKVVKMVDSIVKGGEPEINDTKTY
ncbi:MAG TPA: sugar-binding protein, partial [Anaerovoracaceae bacterium]|nr:sugar-binding protein [Anaerovoracaceae bacterium]